MTVQSVSYYNSIQPTMQLPNYFRQKGWSIQNAVFDANLKYRQVNGEDYPTIADLDYSEEVAKRVLESDDNRRKKSKGVIHHSGPLCSHIYSVYKDPTVDIDVNMIR